MKHHPAVHGMILHVHHFHMHPTCVSTACMVQVLTRNVDTITNNGKVTVLMNKDRLLMIYRIPLNCHWFWIHRYIMKVKMYDMVYVIVMVMVLYHNYHWAIYVQMVGDVQI